MTAECAVNQRRTLWFAILQTVFAAGIVALSMSGCQSTNAIAAANTPDQKAYALYGTFVILEEQAATLMTNPATSPKLRSAVRVADARAKPSADALVKALKDYEAAAAEVKAGGTGAAALLTTATVNLNTWIGTATTDISTLVSAVKGTTL